MVYNTRACVSVAMMLLVSAAAAVTAADVTWDSQFENTLYNTPKGWATTRKSGTIYLMPPDLTEDEEAGIVITPGGELTGDFKDALIQFRADLRGSAKATESSTQSATADEGYPVLYVTEQLHDDAGKTIQYRWFFASHPGKRVEFVLLFANTEDAFKRYSKDFEQFIKTLAYKNVRPGAKVTTAPSTQK